MAKENSQEATAKNVEEAIDLALRELDATREEVAVEVLSPGKPGLLGFGAAAARVRVTLIDSELSTQPEDAQQFVDDKSTIEARDLTQELLNLMKVSASTQIRDSFVSNQDNPILEIEGEDSGLLIGRRGETLASIQFLVNYLLQHRIGYHPRIILDVEGYKKRRNRAMQDLANRMAEKVATTGRPVILEPMPASERRMIHIALAENPQVSTQSTGEGTARKVRISKN
jgi:spoIIIJ-associated protein